MAVQLAAGLKGSGFPAFTHLSSRRPGILGDMAPSSSNTDTAADEAPEHVAPKQAGRRDRTAISGYLLAVAVLLGSLLLVALFWRHASQRELHAAKVEFVAESMETVELVRQRLIQYELTIRGGVALFGTVARPTPVQWKAYVDGIGIGERFPAMVGLGFADHVERGELGALQESYRDSGYGLLEIRPRGVRETYGPILYLEPRTSANVEAIGYDMFSQPLRRAAMESARDSGQARLSAVVHLIQDDDGQSTPAALLMAPVYRAGDVPRTVAARRLSFQGWVYAPFRLQPFVGSAQINVRRDLRFSVHDVTGGGDVLLYASPSDGNAASDAFTHRAFADVYGRRWRFDFHSAPLAVAAPRLATIRTVVLVGLLASLLLFGLAMVLARTEARALKIAGRMTENYRRSELRFRNAMRYSAIGAALLDHDGRIVEANVALGRIVGRDPDHLVGVPFHGLFEGMGSSMEQDMEAISDGVFRVTRQLRRVQDDDVRQVQLTFAPVPGKIGQDVTKLVQVEDVTDRLRAEATVKALNRDLETRVTARTRELSAANKELESFAYSVSHDLRAPLRAIDGFSRLLSDSEGSQFDQEGQDYLGRIRIATTRMGELIDSILKVSRLGRSELKLAPVDLSAMVAEAISGLRRDEPQREVDVVIESDLHAFGDPTLIRNLLQNLLDNAWKFTRDCEHPRIEFGAGPQREDGELEFFVRDNGAGFAAEYSDKLFRPFQRLHPQNEYPGHGIGLASVKRIVERHGGTLRAQGRVGEGATFWFSLPGRVGTD